jgi:hypothetical protein
MTAGILLGLALGLVIGYGAGKIGLKNIGSFFVRIFNRKKAIIERAGESFDKETGEVVEDFNENIKNKFK